MSLRDAMHESKEQISEPIKAHVLVDAFAPADAYRDRSHMACAVLANTYVNGWLHMLTHAGLTYAEH
jgi:hypothetical protein